MSIISYLSVSILRAPSSVAALRSHAFRVFSSYPAHEVMQMPALSPTMTSGTIAKWKVKAGDSVTPGKAIAEIETDKATITLEAMEENIIGKLLVDEGAEVKVGNPILVLLEEGVDAAAFKDFKIAAAPVTTAALPEKAAPIATPSPVPSKPVVAASAPVSPPALATPVKHTTIISSSIENTASVRTIHGGAQGPLHGKLAADQHAYIARFGRGFHRPLALPKEKK